MNNLNFAGRLAKDPTKGDNHCKFVLIRNEYAGKDDAGARKERQVSVQFTAFAGIGEAIANNAKVGDQLIITAHMENNTWTDKEQVKHYDMSYIVDDFDFGAPGAESRKAMEAKKAGN